MKWEYSHHEAGTTGVFHFSWEEWICGPYKIVTYGQPSVYYAYYLDQHVCDPPDYVECQGCAATDCSGAHKAWKTLASAQSSCEDHAASLRVEEYSAELPW